MTAQTPARRAHGAKHEPRGVQRGGCTGGGLARTRPRTTQLAFCTGPAIPAGVTSPAINLARSVKEGMRLALKPTSVAALAAANDVFLSSLKWRVGLTHGSVALVADAKHSLTDVAMDVGALLAAERSDAVQRCFTIAVCVSLCAIAGTFFKDALLAASHGRPPQTVRAVAVVQSTVIATKEVVFRLMRRVSLADSSSALLAAAHHQRADVGVSLGSAVAACLMARGVAWADRACAAAIGVVMVDTARRLFVRSWPTCCAGDCDAAANLGAAQFERASD